MRPIECCRAGPYLPEQDAAWLHQADYEVSFLPYDWHLNARSD